MNDLRINVSNKTPQTLKLKINESSAYLDLNSSISEAMSLIESLLRSAEIPANKIRKIKFGGRVEPKMVGVIRAAIKHALEEK